jgi:NAD(P)-dependent dehydrogenase (short-subunit alcohol dehydrogenase family)
MYLLTGASKGIGHYILEKLIAKTDEKIIALYNSTLPDLKHPNVEWCKVDLNSFSDIEQLINSKAEQFIQVKFINCAGVNHNAMTHKFPEEQWMNLYASFCCPLCVKKSTAGSYSYRQLWLKQVW